MKTKKYWLIGGITLAILYTLFFFVFLIFLYANESSSAGRGLGMITLVIVNIPISLLLEPIVHTLPNFIDDSMFTAGTLLLIAGIVQWFVVGSIICWIYGKIKNRQRGTILN